jgi:GNAT superfamily N-acetyltransferase
MIKLITFEDILDIWSKNLWPDRKSKIESNSAMKFLGGYDMRNMATTPSFFGFVEDGKILGVNSGHSCSDGSYRFRGVFVFPKHRNKGIGTMLLDSVVAQARKENCTFIWGFPRKSSWILYEKYGFILSSNWEVSETSNANAYCKIIL